MLAAFTSLVVAAPTLVWSSSTHVSGSKGVTNSGVDPEPFRGDKA